MANVDLISSVELVYQRTRQAIVVGDYPPGSPLRLNELAGQNGVSLIPVREALRLLEAEGFVESIPNRGARVAALSLEDMHDVYRTRIVLEVEALRQSVSLITAQELRRAHRLNDRLVRQMEHQGYASYEDHRSFHFLLYEPSRSKWLLKLIGIVWDHTERYRRLGAPTVSPEDVRRDHEAILTNTEAGDVQAATEALHYHLEHSVSLMSEAFSDPSTSPFGDLDIPKSSPVPAPRAGQSLPEDELLPGGPRGG